MVDEETPLAGGNVAPVVRVGDTVRRVAGPWTPAVHALLQHLERAGFDGAPQALGMDERGREILTFVPGDVFSYPMPPFVWSEENLERVARLLRAYHDAVRTFVPPPDARWRRAPGAPNGEIICHNDIAPYNTVFRDGEAAAFIDWDLAAPGPPVWDIAYAVWFYVPLYEEDVLGHLDRPRRLTLFLDAYGWEDREAVLRAVLRRQEVAYETLRQWAAEGVPGFVEMWVTGHAEGKLRDRAWLLENWDGLVVSR